MGLFDKIFGRAPKPVGKYEGGFVSLTGHRPHFSRWGGDIYEREIIRAGRHVYVKTIFAGSGEGVGDRRFEVGEGLRGVIVTAVARIDYRDERVLGCNEGCALLGVTHSDDINVAADYRNGIRNAFAL